MAGRYISDEEWNLKIADGIKARSKARGDYNRQVIKELQENKKRASEPAQQEEQHQEQEEEEEVKPKKKRASKKSKDSDSDSDYEEKPKKKRASTKKAKAAEGSDSDAEEEVKPKKTAANPKGAAKPKEPTPAKVKKPTIKDAIVDIVSRKRKGITCKEVLKELRKRGFSTSDVYVRNTCRDLGIVLEHEADRKGWFIRTPGMY